MKKSVIPAGYVPPLDDYDMQRAIESVKAIFQKEFADALNLKRFLRRFL